MKYKTFPFLSFIMISGSNECDHFWGGYRIPESGVYNMYESLAIPDHSDSELDSEEILLKKAIPKCEYRKIIRRLKKLAETHQTMSTSGGRTFRVIKFSTPKKKKLNSHSCSVINYTSCDTYFETLFQNESQPKKQQSRKKTDIKPRHSDTQKVAQSPKTENSDKTRVSYSIFREVLLSDNPDNNQSTDF